MDEKVKYVEKQKDIIEKYIKLIEEECKGHIITYNLDKKRDNTTLDDVEKYKDFYNDLDKTCDTDVFKKLCDFIFTVPKTCSIITNLSGDGGSTSFEYNGNTKEIIGVDHIDLPPFIRPSLDFIYLHEAVHGLFWEERKGKKFIDYVDVEVLPYFFMLYALKNLYKNYDEETINSILGRFIVNAYSSAQSISEGFENRFVHYSDKDLKEKFYFEKYQYQDIREKKNEIYMDYKQFLGPIKAIILYNYCICEDISFETVLNSVLDSEKTIGTELDYSYLDIEKEENFETYKSFVKKHKKVLPVKKKKTNE